MVKQYSYEEAVAYGRKHHRVHQYTTYEALKKIISNKSLLLNRIDRVNDTIENRYIDDLWKKKVYIACFTHREHESYFFWNTYAKSSSIGVMISFLTADLRELSIHPDAECEKAPLGKCNKSDLSIGFSPAVDASTWGVFDYSVLDVMYCPRDIDPRTLDHFQGRIKFPEWDMESETRIRVAIRPKCLEARNKAAEIEYLTPENEYVFAKLPETCFESMVITLSPYADKTLKCQVEELLKNNGLLDKVQIRDSILTGEAVSSTHQSNS